MAIEIHDDYIQFGDTKITQTAAGISLGHKKLRASQIFERSPVQGSISGYTSGGTNPALTPTTTNVIDMFPFSSDADATDVGDLSQARARAAGQSSAVSGYTSGGIGVGYVTTIDKFPFSASFTTATDVGDLTQGRYNVAGQSSTENGYASGGNAPPYSNVIDKFPFSADADATDVGDLTQTRNRPTGQSSSESGYTSGGQTPTPTISDSNTIDKFPFASNANATDVGDLTQARQNTAGQSSAEYGYASGGYPETNTIDKFQFASDANATDVGDLTQAKYAAAGQSSETHGYTSGGYVYPLSNTQVIEKFPFAIDTNSTAVSGLTLSRFGATGQQV